MKTINQIQFENEELEIIRLACCYYAAHCLNVSENPITEKYDTGDMWLKKSHVSYEIYHFLTSELASKNETTN